MQATDDAIIVDGKELKVTAIRNPGEIPWSECGVDIVVDATGIFRSKELVMPHIEQGGAKGYHHRSGQRRRHNHRHGRQR